MKKYLFCFLFLALFAVQAQARTVTDMRGKQVVVPDKLTRIATIDDGFVEGILTHLGEIKSVAVIGSWSMKRDYKYSFEVDGGEPFTLRGWNTMKYLHPWLNDLPCVNSPQGNVINYELLAKENPELVILRVGDCTVGANNQEGIAKTIATIEALEIPLVVLYAPAYYKAENPISGLRAEGEVVGDVFGKKAQAAEFMQYLASFETLVQERTANIAADKRPKVLYMGLNPNVRKSGGAGSVHGVDTPESYILEQIVHASNAFRGKGSGVPLSAEQVYALDPDLILLPTSNGYHPPRELLEAPYYQNLQELRAVKSKRVFAMPWSPMNCSRRVEYPLDLLIMAKAAYPEQFADISVYETALGFYQKAYGVDVEKARGLRSEQLLDWMKDINF